MEGVLKYHHPFCKTESQELNNTRDTVSMNAYILLQAQHVQMNRIQQTDSVLLSNFNLHCLVLILEGAFKQECSGFNIIEACKLKLT